MTKPPYTAAEYGDMAKRIAREQAALLEPYPDGMRFTARELDIIFTALGIAMAHEIMQRRALDAIDEARRRGADI